MPPPPPPTRLCTPELQSTCYYIVNNSVKIWHVRLVNANYMLTALSCGGGGGGTNGKVPEIQCSLFLKFAFIMINNDDR